MGSNILEAIYVCRSFEALRDFPYIYHITTRIPYSAHWDSNNEMRFEFYIHLRLIYDDIGTSKLNFILHYTQDKDDSKQYHTT